MNDVAQHFQIYGDFISAEPYGSGHINDTYCVVFHQAGVSVRYIFQRINHNIFKNPVALMENVQRVTTHLAHRAVSRVYTTSELRDLWDDGSADSIWHHDIRALLARLSTP